MLVRLIYASTATEGVGLTEFRGILQQSQVNNHKRDLTGVLAFNSKIFLQGLEGSREQVNELYSRLLRDQRHHTVAMLEYAEIDEREWAQWSMGFAAPSADNRALFLKYSGQSLFNPYGMRGHAVKKMLGELAGKSITMSPPAERVDGATSTGTKPAAQVTAPAPLSEPTPRQTTDSGFLGRLLNR
jgi:Sensors of blue-light using FAD